MQFRLLNYLLIPVSPSPLLHILSIAPTVRADYKNCILKQVHTPMYVSNCNITGGLHLVTDFKHRGTWPISVDKQALLRTDTNYRGGVRPAPADRHQLAWCRAHRGRIQTVPRTAVPPMLQSYMNGWAMTTHNDMLRDELLYNSFSTWELPEFYFYDQD